MGEYYKLMKTRERWSAHKITLLRNLSWIYQSIDIFIKKKLEIIKLLVLKIIIQVSMQITPKINLRKQVQLIE